MSPRLAWSILILGWFPWWYLALAHPGHLQNPHLLWIGVAAWPVWSGGLYGLWRGMQLVWSTRTTVPLFLRPVGIIVDLPPATALKFTRYLILSMSLLGTAMGWLLLLATFASTGG